VEQFTESSAKQRAQLTIKFTKKKKKKQVNVTKYKRSGQGQMIGLQGGHTTRVHT
jgi:hypothetical protein